MANRPNTEQPTASVDRSATLIETDEDVRQALMAGRGGSPPSNPAPSGPVCQSEPNSGRLAMVFRPTVRPPVPILTVFDDGKMDGEVIRLREPRFTIGRTEGDLRFPLDGRMSARHVEITHQVLGGLHRWVVTDLLSTHGMFIRVSRSALADKAEFLVGNGRYRFDDSRPDSGTAAEEPGGLDTGQTQGWAEGTGSYRPPAVTELLGREVGNRVLLIKPEYWIGADPSCAVCRPDDPFCELRHVRLSRSAKGTWVAEHNKTRNGLWLRMAQITVEGMVLFQIGEQRFKLTVQ